MITNFFNKSIKELTLDNFTHTIPETTQEQLDFANDITTALINDKDSTKINVVSAPCGFGKSVLIRSYLKANIFHNSFGGKYKGDGFVIVTDMLDRFLDYENDTGLEGYYYQMRHDKNENFQRQVIEQQEYPILLMTTQKYFMLNNSERSFIFKWNYGRRNTIIFDEKPLFYTINEIDKKFINDIDNEIDKILETDDKRFLNDEIKYLRDYLENEKGRLSNNSTENVYCYWKGIRENIGTDDKRFIELTDKYLSQESKNKIKVIKDVLENGAVFVNKKTKSATDSRKIFFTVTDNKPEFYLDKDKAKIWVFDATADVDVEYQKDYINMIKIKYSKKFKVNIKNIDISTSKNNMRETNNIQILNKYLTKDFDKENALVVSYKEHINKLGYKFKHRDYFGGMKGTNKYRECTQMAHIGLNRFSDIGYLQIYLALYPEVYQHVQDKLDGSKSILNKLLEMEYGNFTNKRMYRLMYSKLLVDVEQNIFRTKLRNYNNKDRVYIYLFYNSNTYAELNNSLAKRLSINEITSDVPPEILKHKILSRDNEKPSVAQRIVSWFSENEGYGEIKTGDLLKQIGITNNQLCSARRDNISLKNLMDSKKTKRGIYKV